MSDNNTPPVPEHMWTFKKFELNVPYTDKGKVSTEAICRELASFCNELSITHNYTFTATEEEK